MELIIAVPVLLAIFAFPLMGGLMAINFGRKFWPWFWLSFPFPFITCVVLLCLPPRNNVHLQSDQDHQGHNKCHENE